MLHSFTSPSVLLVWPRAGRADSESLSGRGAGGRRRTAGRPRAARPCGPSSGEAWGSSGCCRRTGPAEASRHAISGAVDGEPGWLAHVQLSVAHAVGNGGGRVAIACAVAVLRDRPRSAARRARPRLFLVAGAALALVYWVFGEAFGEPFSGIATDPNTGPLLVLLALALYPNRVHVLGQRPAPGLNARRRSGATGRAHPRLDRTAATDTDRRALLPASERHPVGGGGAQASRAPGAASSARGAATPKGSAPSSRSAAASEMLAASGSCVSPQRVAVGVDAEELGRVEAEHAGLHLVRQGGVLVDAPGTGA